MRRIFALTMLVGLIGLIAAPVGAETVIGGIDMGIVKTVDSPVAARGDTLTYTLTATNYGEFGEREGYVVDTLPDGVTFVSVDAPTADSCTVAGQTIECYFPAWIPLTIDPALAVHTITIVVTVDADATGTLVNHTLVESRDPSPTAPVDADPTNDEDTASTDVILASIGDFVWLDDDGDGVQDPGELGIPGVVVEIDGVDGPMSTTTDADGMYLFDNLSGGDYTVTVDQSTAPANTTITTPGSVSTSVAAGDAFLDADFGFQPPPPEPPDEIIDLELTKTVSPTSVSVGSNAVFTLSLTNLGPDDATGVVVGDVLPAGLTFVSSSDPGSFDGFTWTVGDVNVGDVLTLDITVTADVAGPFTNVAEVTDADQEDSDSTPGDGSGDDYDEAVLTTTEVLATGSIGDTVWLDSDGDGVEDPGESGIAGVTVTLDGPTGPQSAVTDASGKYIFVGLPAGTYTVAVVTSTAGESLGLTTPGSMSVNLGDGATYLEADFGFVPVLPITGVFAANWFFTGIGFLIAGILLLAFAAALRDAAAKPVARRLQAVGASQPLGPNRR
ncbi:MAG: DUF11 domain-containing protein [Acidimicrobiia bacterium]|nr:DUF11 domain-containing protein [Acidimicrobiia bacterium]